MKAKRAYPIFNSHLDFAHETWEKILESGCWAIDATCGNGHDTLKLAQLVGASGGVIGIDIQEKAIENTEARLTEARLKGQPKVHLFQQSHETFPALAYENPISLIVYNLGYLPGGNKDLTTLTSSTLNSVSQALDLLSFGGALSLTCYPGHAEGAAELLALLDFFEGLSPLEWNVTHHQFLNHTELRPQNLY